MAGFTWEHVMAPLMGFCRNPVRAFDFRADEAAPEPAPDMNGHVHALHPQRAANDRLSSPECEVASVVMPPVLPDDQPLPREVLPVGWQRSQELIADQRPDLIVETGTYKGAGSLFLASICEL